MSDLGETEFRGTGKWRQKGVPHKGWQCVLIEDLEATAATCEMCEVVQIRYVHVMEHPDYPEPLNCGCICAGHMEGDYEAASQREKVAKARAKGRRDFARRAGWRWSQKGTRYIRVEGHLLLVAPRQDGRYSVGINFRREGEVYWSRQAHEDEADAMRAAYDPLCEARHGGRKAVAAWSERRPPTEERSRKHPASEGSPLGEQVAGKGVVSRPRPLTTLPRGGATLPPLPVWRGWQGWQSREGGVCQ